jgi:uncharacterized protein
MKSSRAQELSAVLEKSEKLMAVLRLAETLRLPDWYVAGGAVSQTYWNARHGYDLDRDIADYDLVYYDPDLSYEAEDAHIKRAREVFGAELSASVEVRNQARVHLWYHERNGGDPIAPLASTEDAISHWLVPASSVGVRLNNGELKLCAPLGIDDVLNMHVRPNPKKASGYAAYRDKVRRWQSVWPQLTAEEWPEPGA